MVELTGKDCPLLFDKWQPDKVFDDKPKGRIGKHYIFPFAFVNEETNLVPTRKDGDVSEYIVNGTSRFDIGKYQPDLLFDPKLKEMYFDAKKFFEEFKKKIEASPPFQGCEIGLKNSFQRIIGFTLNADYDKLEGGFENIKGRKDIIQGVYQSLEDRLVKEFGLKSEEFEDYYILPDLIRTADGQAKILRLKNNVMIYTPNPIDFEIGVGTIYPRIVVDETGEKKQFDDVFRVFTEHLNSNFSEKLNKYNEGAYSIGVTGDGTFWQWIMFAMKKPMIETGEPLKLLKGPETFK